MPIEILVSARSVKAQLKNGDSFTLNPADIGTHLKGSVMEKLRATHSVDIKSFAVAAQSDLWYSTLILNPVTQIGNVTRLRRETGDFVSDGFADGDGMNCEFNPYGLGTTFITAAILIVQPDVLILDQDVGAGVNTYGLVDFSGGGADSRFIMRNIQKITALKFKYGLVENSESMNFESKVEGTEQSYYVDGLGLIPDLPAPQVRGTAFQIGESSEIFKGWETGALKARFVNDPANFTQRFEIEHEFTVLPYAKIDDVETVFELYESLNSLRYVFQAEFRTVLSNPNTSKTITDDFQKGSVANYGENFNGINTQYSITSIAIADALANSIDTLEVGTTNTVTVVVNSNDGTFIAAQPFIIYHSFLPTSDDYRLQTDDFETVWIYDNVRNTIGAVAASSSAVTNVVAVLDNANQITVTFDISYTTAQQARISENNEFVLAIGVGDDTLSTDLSDKTVLKVKQAEYTKDTDVPGLMSVSEIGFFDHPTDFLTGTGFTNYIGAIEDGMLVEVPFTLDRALNAFLESLQVNLVAFNAITEDEFIIQKNIVDLTSQVIVPEGAFDVQEINVDTTRGFLLEALDQFNFFKLSTSPLSGSDKPYNLQFGIKADWRESLALPDANTVFYNNSEVENGLNHLMSNYKDNGYTQHLYVTAQVSEGNVTTEYNFRSAAITIFDYDDSLALDWVCTVETFNVAGTSLGGNISNTENTRIKVTFDSASIIVADESDYWGIIRIEQENNQGLNAIEELSSERGGVKNQLIPLIGQIQTKKSIETDNLVLECLVDFTKLVPGIEYKPSSRFGLGDSSAPLGGKLKEDGDFKNKEDGDFKFKE